MHLLDGQNQRWRATNPSIHLGLGSCSSSSIRNRTKHGARAEQGDDATTEEEQQLREFWSREQAVDVLPYLARLWSATRQLAATRTADDKDGDVVMDDDNDDDDGALLTADQYIEQIALGLLQACQLSVLTQDTENYLPPPPPPVQSVHDVIGDDNENNDNDDDLQSLYRLGRIDYLRLLLRAMKPVALDVAAHACRHVQYQLLQSTSSDAAAPDNDNENRSQQTGV